MYKNFKHLKKFIFGSGCISQLKKILSTIKNTESASIIYLIDHFFGNGKLAAKLPVRNKDYIYYIDTTDEPEIEGIDTLSTQIKEKCDKNPVCIIGIGGGATLDTAKAISNLFTNSGKAEDYQGWDLVKKPGIFKIGIPTISGTGAESSRTCVLTNTKKKIKLGMNSDFTVFDQLILDPDLTASVPRDQYFYTGIDTYLHCMESLNGSYRNNIVDVLSEKAIELCKEVFLSDDMQSSINREKMMSASYLGGCAAGNVGAVHPLSAGLSIALKIHHGLANCIIMNIMDEFYPKEFDEFSLMLEKQKINLPMNISKNVSLDIFEKFYHSSIIHEKPLTNALGERFKDILTKKKIFELFKRI